MSKGNWLIALVLLVGAAFCMEYFGLFKPIFQWNLQKHNNERVITEVVLKFDHTSLQFTKSDNHWVGTKEGVVLQNIGAKLDSLLDVLIDLENSSFKSDKMDQYDYFGVQEQSALKIDFIAGGKTVKILIGSFNSTESSTYFRYQGSKIIFAKKGNIRALVSDRLSDYRFNILPEVIVDQLTSVQYYWNDKLAFGYNFSEESWCSQLQSFYINRYDFEDYLYRINDLRTNVEGKQTIKRIDPLNEGSIVFHSTAVAQSSVINFLESVGKNKIYYLYDPNQKNTYLKLDSAAFFGKIWVNPSTFIKNN